MRLEKTAARLLGLGPALNGVCLVIAAGTSQHQIEIAKVVSSDFPNCCDHSSTALEESASTLCSFTRKYLEALTFLYLSQ